MGTHASLLQPEVRASECFLRDEVPAETSRTNRSLTDKERKAATCQAVGSADAETWNRGSRALLEGCKKGS